MKKALTVVLLILGGLAANILVNAAVLAAWDFNGAGACLSVIVGMAAAAIVCVLAAVLCQKLQVRRRTLLICTQSLSFAIAAVLFIGGAVKYHDVMSSAGLDDMWSGLRYGLTCAFFEIFTAIFITVSLTTIALALTLCITYRKMAKLYRE